MRVVHLATKVSLALWLLGCGVNLSTPKPSQISCATNAQCPAGWTCDPAIGRCAALGGNGEPAPGFVGQPQFDRTLLGRAMRATLTFDATSALGADPQVILQLGAGVALHKDVTASAGAHYVYTYTALGPETEPQEVDVPVTAVLTNLWGESSSALTCGSLRFDFTAPAIQPGSASVQLRSDYPQGNPLSSVLQATNGTRVEVTFSLTKALAANSPPPSLVFFTGMDADGKLSGAVDLTAVTFQGTTYTYSAKLSGVAAATFSDQILLLGAPEVAAAAQIVDAVGNTPSTLLVATFEVNTNAPAVPATAVSENIVLRRMPWGNESGSPSPLLALSGAPGSLPPGVHHLAVYHQLPASPATSIGLIDVAIDGSFVETPLASPDLPVAFVTSVDDAGNQSAAVEVKDVVWTASLGHKQPFELTNNPSTLLSTSALSPLLEQSPATTTEPSAAAVATLWPGAAGGMVTGSASWSWRNVVASTSTAWPAGRVDAAVAYDPGPGRLLVFGGTDANGARQDAWQWDTAARAWTQRASANPAPGSVGFAPLVFANDLAQSVLFDGTDLWAWNDASSNWKPITPSNGSPTPPRRDGHVAAYDELRHKLLVFGGKAASGALADLWEFDFVTLGWTQRALGGAAPAPRRYAAAAFDSTRGTLLVFGGDDGAATLLGDTWEWSPYSDAWTQVATTGPGARRQAAIAYDAGHQAVVLYGGINTFNPPLFGNFEVGDEWRWTWDAGGSTGSWQSVAATGLPSRRFGACLVYEKHTGHLLLFGGSWLPAAGSAGGHQAYSSDFYDLDPQTQQWQRITAPAAVTSTAFKTRTAAAMAYDESARALVLAGGFEVTMGAPMTDADSYLLDVRTGVWSGPIALPDYAGNGGARQAAAMAYDPVLGHVILYGGNLGSTVVNQLLQLVSGAWTVIAVALPPARYQAELATDPVTGTVLLFGGRANATTTLADVRLWNGSAWSQPTTSGTPPPSRAAFGMAVDPVNRKLVVYGGVSGDDCGVGGGSRQILGDTWELDLTSWAWVPMYPTHSPPAGLGQRLVYDESRGTVMSFASQSACSSVALDQIWEWDSVSQDWNPIAVGVQPTSRYGFAVARDAAIGLDVMAAGNVPLYGDTETWAIDLSPTLVPAVIWQVPFAAALPPALFSVTQITGTATAGGIGRAPGATNNTLGAAVSRWDTLSGRWLPMASNIAELAQPTPIDWNLSLARDLAGALTGPQATLHFAITPQTGSVAGTLSQAKLDAIETTVRYHRGAQVSWQFDTDGNAEGWTTANVSVPGAPSGGQWIMTFDQGNPQLLSPPINLQASQYAALQLRVQSSAAVTATLRWQRVDAPSFDDAKSTSVTIAGAAAWQTTRLLLADVSSWQGEVTSLRLDLAAAVAQSLAIDWVHVTE